MLSRYDLFTSRAMEEESWTGRWRQRSSDEYNYIYMFVMIDNDNTSVLSLI